MHPEFDAIIVGSGPAGVSAAFPLLDAGLRVLMVDGGREPNVNLPDGEHLDTRAHDQDQWKWMVGRNFYALRALDAISPKFRAPTLEYVFNGFAEANRIVADNFVAIGSLAAGGLSNAWGCGVARLSSREFETFPFPESELLPSYEAIGRRIGISGRSDDDMADYFGVDAWAQEPVPMDTKHEYLFRNYRQRRDTLVRAGFRLGRARLAVLTEDRAGLRKACDRSGFCLWGCKRGALYSAYQDLIALKRYANLTWMPDFIVNHFQRDGANWLICGRGFTEGSRTEAFCGNILVLAAGTLATTRLVLDALRIDRPIPIRSAPIAAFMLWLPRFFGQPVVPAFGLGQLSFSARTDDVISCFGSTFSLQGLPISEFVGHMPFTRRTGIDILRCLFSSCLVGNCFLPGRLSESTVQLQSDNKLKVIGNYGQHALQVMERSKKVLRKAFLQIGALMLPGSFLVGRPGGDVHYTGTIPMRREPRIGETSRSGEVRGLDRVFVVDGASLPDLTEKSHTMTIMANADRIGREISRLVERYRATV